MQNKNKTGITGLDHPALAASDVDALAEWYCDNLDYEKFFRHDKPVWLLRAPDNSFLEIMPIDNTPRPSRTTWTPGWSHTALRVNDIEKTIAFLDTRNITWTGELMNAVGGGRVRSFQDPEGNMLQLIER